MRQEIQKKKRTRKFIKWKKKDIAVGNESVVKKKE